MITLDDDYRLKDFGLIPLQEHVHPMTAKFSNKTLSIPGRVGLWDFGTETMEKEFNIPIGMIEWDKVEMQQKINSFVAFLLDDFGRPRTIKLVFDYEPDKFYFVKVSNQMDVERLVHASRFDLPLVANDPYKYSRLYGDEVVWGSEVITFEWHYLLGHTGDGASSGVSITSPTTINVNVEGLTVKPVFEINGTANNLKIECDNYSFTLPNFSNAKWIIDFEKYTATRNGQEQILDGINDFYLMPGSNAVKITGSNINLDMKIKFRDKYN